MGDPAHLLVASEYPNHINWATRWRVPHFADEALARRCLEAIEHQRHRMGLEVFGYALMPDHFHILLAPQPRPLGYVVQALKLASVHRLMSDGMAPGTLWQEGYFDKALRNHRQVRKAIEYVHNNPSEAALTDERASYLFSSCRDYETDHPGILRVTTDLGLNE